MVQKLWYRDLPKQPTKLRRYGGAQSNCSMLFKVTRKEGGKVKMVERIITVSSACELLRKLAMKRFKVN